MKVVTKIIKYKKNNRKFMFFFSSKQRPSIERIINQNDMELPKNQWFFVAEFEDRTLFQDEKYMLTEQDNATITLYLEPEDFEVDEKTKNIVLIEKKLPCSKYNYIEYGCEGKIHIVAKFDYFLKDLSDHFGEQLSISGKLTEFMEADGKFDYSNEERAQDDPRMRYNSVEQNNYYILRHAFVYASVYYRMFRSLLKSLPSDRKIGLHILSIGCGSKTDAVALRQALRYCDNDVTVSKYVGMDPGEWNRSEYFLYLNHDDEYIHLHNPEQVNDRTVIEQEIDYIASSEYKKKLEQFQNNEVGQAVYLIVFPNSISEMNVDDVERLLECIRLTYEGKKLYLCLSKNVYDSNGESIDDLQISKIEEFFGVSAFRECNGGYENEDGQTEERDKIDQEIYEAFGIEIIKNQNVRGISMGDSYISEIWNDLKISADDLESQMNESMIQRELEGLSEQERNEREDFIREQISDKMEKQKKYLQKSDNKGEQKANMLSFPLTKLDKYDCYRIYEVSE